MWKIISSTGIITLIILTGCIMASAEGEGEMYPDRWVYVSQGLRQDKDVSQVREVVKTASEHGLNGMVLSSGLDGLSRKSADYLERLQEVKEFCQENNVEIIPIIFSAGYGGSILGHNKNLAAGLPVKDALYVVDGDEARLAADPPVEIVNGGFEKFEDNRFDGYNFHDKPGQISFADHDIVKTGKTSLRFQHFGELDPKNGHARVMQEINVHPYRYYRITCWVKTDGLQGRFRIQVLTEDGRALAPYDPGVPETTDWRKVTMAFNSLEYDRVKLYAGMWGGKAGRLWLDDLKIEELGLVNVLRRPGTPVTVVSDDGKTVYNEGSDYENIADPELNPWRGADHDPPPIRISPNSRIADGQRLRVSFYHSVVVNRSQVSICMSEPEVYDIWREEARLLHQQLRPQKYLLSMDEIRAGGSCAACKARNMSIAQIYGDFITRGTAIIRQVNPQAEIVIWSDMLDPNQNADSLKWSTYYHVSESYHGSWNYIPKDLIIACWYNKIRRKSLDHFSGLGFRTIAAAYYDADDLENPKQWLAELDDTPGAQGIIYTSWRNKYELLGPFGDLVSGWKKGK